MIAAAILFNDNIALGTQLSLFALPFFRSLILGFSGLLPCVVLGTRFALVPCRFVFDTVSIFATVAFETCAFYMDLSGFAVRV
jgi:hypothetical protein